MVGYDGSIMASVQVGKTKSIYLRFAYRHDRMSESGQKLT